MQVKEKENEKINKAFNDYGRRPFTLEEKQRMLNKTNNKCAHCGKKLTLKTMTVEHIIPVSRGGSNHEYNTIALCNDCNKDKYDLIYEFEAYFNRVKPEEIAEYYKRLRIELEHAEKDEIGLDNSLFPLVTLKARSIIKRSMSGVYSRKGSCSSRFLVQDIMVEKAYMKDIDNIVEFVKKDNDKKRGYSNWNDFIEYYSIHSNLVNALYNGDIYIGKNKSDEILLLIIFENIEEFSKESIKELEELNKNNTKISKVLTFAISKLEGQSLMFVLRYAVARMALNGINCVITRGDTPIYPKMEEMNESFFSYLSAKAELLNRGKEQVEKLREQIKEYEEAGCKSYMLEGGEIRSYPKELKNSEQILVKSNFNGMETNLQLATDFLLHDSILINFMLSLKDKEVNDIIVKAISGKLTEDDYNALTTYNLKKSKSTYEYRLKLANAVLSELGVEFW